MKTQHLYNLILGLILSIGLGACGNPGEPLPKTDDSQPENPVVPSPSADAQGSDCTADEGYAGGCIKVPLLTGYSLLQNEESGSGEIELFYQWLGDYVPSKPVIVFINGGPGGSYKPYAKLKNTFSILNRTHNILFYDQRGTGKSAPILESSEGEKKLEYYHTRENIEDLEQLRIHVAGQDKIILMGHSYGGHIAYGYASRYPDNVKSLIVLNGASDNSGFIGQKERLADLRQQIESDFNANEILAFYELLKDNKILDNDGNIVSRSLYFQTVNDYLSTFVGQKQLVASLLSQLLIINNKAVTQFIADHLSPSNSSDENGGEDEEKRDGFVFTSSNDGDDAFAGLSQLVNLNIVCHDMLADFLDSSDMTFLNSYPLTRRYFLSQCVLNKDFDPQRIQKFDFKEDIDSINVPTLIFSGSHDPLVPAALQIRDFDILKSTNSQVRLIEMENTGHQIFYENAKCFNEELEDFLLDDSIEVEKRAC